MSCVFGKLLRPIGVRGLKSIDHKKFLRNIQVPILKVNEETVSKIIHLCKPYLFKILNFKPLQDFYDDPSYKCIHLNPVKLKTWNDIPEDTRKQIVECGVKENNFFLKEIQLTYDNWTSEDVFKEVLPENQEIVRGFSQIGHIVHLNLKDHLLEYKHLIGQVLHDKIKTCRTVVNKINIIDNTYRNFKMEVIAGEEDFIVTVSENRCKFQFDFSKVYWNPRLSKEHETLLGYMKPGDVLFDIFCGVGPFSIPAAKRKCEVFANDLNPDSYKWLNHNAKSNKVNMAIFHSYNLDGKDFIKTVMKQYLYDVLSSKKNLEKMSKIHIIMNLPAIAIDFLYHFKGLINNSELTYDLCNDILVYVYCFVHGDEPEADATKMVSEKMCQDMSPFIVNVFDVRNVAPKKQMMRVTIKLTKEILVSNQNDVVNHEPPFKKMCLDNKAENN